MRGSKALPREVSATLDDCARLWDTLTIDYIPGLKIEIIPVRDRNIQPCILVELVDYSHGQTVSSMQRSVWAVRQFASPLYLISHAQLFDLLISGFRVIEEYFSTGKDNRPSTLKG